MQAGQFQRHPLGDHPLFAAGMDEQQVFLAILEKAEIAARIAFFGRHLEAARRRQPARRGRRDIGLDAVQRVDGDALALAQAMHQLAVVDGPAAKRRLRHVGMAAELRDLAENLVVLHRADLGSTGGQDGMAGLSYHHLPNGGNPRRRRHGSVSLLEPPLRGGQQSGIRYSRSPFTGTRCAAQS